MYVTYNGNVGRRTNMKILMNILFTPFYIVGFIVGFLVRPLFRGYVGGYLVLEINEINQLMEKIKKNAKEDQ